MKNFSLVSIFNSSKTLNENNEVVINEGNTLSTLAATFKDAESLKTANPSMFKTFQDILKFSGDEGKYIEGFTGPNRTNFTKIKTVDELLYAVKNGMRAKDLGRFYTGCLKSANTPMELVVLSAKEVANSQAFIKKYSSYTPNNLKIELKNRKYSDAAINALLNETKGKTTAFNTARSTAKKIKKTKVGGGEVELTPTTQGEIVKPNADGTSLTVTNAETKSVVEVSKQKLNELITGVKGGWNWKKVLSWGAAIGLSAAALWWAIYKLSDTVPSDMPVQEPPVGGKWAPCIQELLTSKEGQMGKDGSVVVKPADFPGGLQFYNNGRVMDVVGKKMGTWKCKGTKAVIAETQKINLSGLLNEQGSQVTDEQMDSYVDTAVDDLDGYVAEYNLKSLLNILTALKGKTYQGQDAITKFLEFYKQDEGVDFVSDVNSVGVANLSVMAKNMKPQIIALSKGGGVPTATKTPPTGGNKGLGGIDIIWDGQKKEGEKVTTTVKKSKYHDCSGKDTFEFGCKSPKIKEIQTCLGMEGRYQTGNFGPLTKKALEDAGYDVSKGITVDIYSKIKAACTDNSNVRAPKLDGSIEPLKTNKTPIAPVNADNLKMPNIQPVGQGNRGESIYNGLKNNFNDKTLQYIFSSGGRIKYKGDDLGDDVLGQLDQYIGTLGYQRIKEKDKDYGVKYVWAKQ